MITERMRKQGKGFYKKEVEFSEPTEKGKRAYRANEVLQAVVEVDNLQFNADEKSMDRIDRVVEVANAKFARALAQGVSPTDAYEEVYGTEVPWKSADNVFHQVTVETLCLVQEKALEHMNMVWQRYG